MPSLLEERRKEARASWGLDTKQEKVVASEPEAKIGEKQQIDLFRSALSDITSLLSIPSQLSPFRVTSERGAGIPFIERKKPGETLQEIILTEAGRQLSRPIQELPIAAAEMFAPTITSAVKERSIEKLLEHPVFAGLETLPIVGGVLGAAKFLKKPPIRGITPKEVPVPKSSTSISERLESLKPAVGETATERLEKIAAQRKPKEGLIIPSDIFSQPVEKLPTALEAAEKRLLIKGQKVPPGSENILSEAESITRPEKVGIPLLTRALDFPKKIQTSLVSEFSPLARVEKQLYELEGKEYPRLNIARKFEQVAGAPAKAEADIIKFTENVIAPIGGDLQNLNTYLFLKRTQSRLVADPKIKKVGDWTVDKTKLGLQALEQKLGAEKYSSIRQVAEQSYQKAMDDSLRLQVASGRVSPELYQIIKQSNDFYAPFKVLRELEEGESVVGGAGRRIATKAELTKKIKGISSEDFKIGNIVEESAKQIYKSRILAEKNFKMLEFDGLIPFDKEGNIVKYLKEGERPSAGKEAISYLKNGKPVRVEVPKEVAQSIQGLNATQSGILAKTLATVKTPLQFGATGANASFQVVNLLFADIPRQAIISKYGLRSPVDLIKYPTDLAYAFATSMKGNFGKPNELYMEWLNSGAARSTFQRVITPEVFEPAAIRGTLQRVPGKILDSIGRFANAIEETTKILGLKRAKEIEGLGKLHPQEAIKKLEEIVTEIRNYSGSPDFARKGLDTTQFNLLAMFFNARVQGAASDISRLAGATGKREAVAAWSRLSAIVGIPALTLAVVNRLPQYAKDFDQIPDTEKENYFMIPTNRFFTTDEGERVRDYYRIPKREIVKIFGNTVESFVDFASRKDARAFGNLAVNIAENLSPINIEGRDIRERGESAIGSLNPLLKLPYELVSGRQTFGHRQIIPRSLEGAAPAEQFKRTTPDIFKKVGQALNVSPLVVEQAVGTTTGGLFGQFAVPQAEIGRAPLVKFPIIKRFFRSGITQEPLEELKAIKKEEETETTARVRINRRAQEAVESMRKLKLEDIPNRLIELQSSDPEIAPVVNKLIKEKASGIDYKDKLVKQLGIGSGARAKYIVSTLEIMKTDEEKREYLIDLSRKKLLTGEVFGQVKILLGKPR